MCIHSTAVFVDVTPVGVQELNDRADVKRGLHLIRLTVGLELDDKGVPQFLYKLVDVGAAVALQLDDELGHIPEHVGRDGFLPVVVVYQLLDVIVEGQLLLVVLAPNQRRRVPDAAFAVQPEMRRGGAALRVLGIVSGAILIDKVPHAVSVPVLRPPVDAPICADILDLGKK